MVSSGNRSSPYRRQVNTWTNTEQLSVGLLRNKLKWNLDQSDTIFIKKIAFEIFICKTMTILFRSRIYQIIWNVRIWAHFASLSILLKRYLMFYDDIIYSLHNWSFHWTTVVNLLLPSEAHNSFHQLTFFLPVFEPHMQSIKPLLRCTLWHACARRCHELTFYTDG